MKASMSISSIVTSALLIAGSSISSVYGSPVIYEENISARAVSPINIRSARGFAVLATTGISSVPASSITGNIGLSPAAASFITGFSLTQDSTNVFSTSTQVIGKVFASNYAVPTPSNLVTATADITTAYNAAAGLPNPNFLALGAGAIGGKILTAGLYKWTTGVTVLSDVTLLGLPTDVWVFQISGALSVANAKKIILVGGLASNVFWQVGGGVTVGAGGHFEGIILSKLQVVLQTGASMNGRILGQTAVTLQKAVVTQPLL